MEYRKALESDIDSICAMIKAAVVEMEKNGIYQWDDLYPMREDFLADLSAGHLFVGVENGEPCVVYVVNKECDEEYNHAAWKYPESEYRVIHRLCVNPAVQNRGIAKKTLAHIEEELLKDGVSSIRLDVFSQNPFALSLYKKDGYEAVGTASWRKGTFYLMEKAIGGKSV